MPQKEEIIIFKGISYRIVNFSRSLDQKLQHFPPLAADDHGFHCTALGSRSQNPRGTLFSREKVTPVDPRWPHLKLFFFFKKSFLTQNHSLGQDGRTKHRKARKVVLI